MGALDRLIEETRSDDISGAQAVKAEMSKDSALSRLKQEAAVQISQEQFPVGPAKEKPQLPEAKPPQKPAAQAVKEVKEGAQPKDRGVIKDTAMQVVGGARDAGQELIDGALSLNSFIQDHAPRIMGQSVLPIGMQVPSPEEGITLPNVPEPDTLVGGLARGMTQFLVGFLPTAKVLGVFGKGTAAVKAGKAAVASMTTDFAVFDPHAERLSNFIEEFPVLKNPVTQYLAADENDSEIEGRMKNVLEGLGMDAITAGAFSGSLKLIRKAGKMRAASKVARATEGIDKGASKAAAQQTEQASKQAIKQVTEDVPAEDILGKEAGPLTRTKKARTVEAPTVTEPEAKLFLDLQGETKKKALNINLARIETEADIKAVIDKTAQVFEDEIKIATRGKQSNQLTQELADEMGLSLGDILGREGGTAFNAEQLLAARKVLVSSGENLRNMALKIQTAEATDADLLRFRKAVSLHAGIQKQVSGLTAEAGRALQQFNIMARSKKEQLNAIRDLLDSTGGRGTAHDLAQAIVETTDPRQINKIIDQAHRADSFDMVMEYWLNSILSGPRTHMVNITSNAFNAVLQIPERAGAAMISKITGSADGVRGGEVLAQMHGFIQGIQDGWIMAKHAWKTEGIMDPLTKIEGVDKRAITAANLSKTYLGKTANTALKSLGRKTLEEGGLAARFVNGVGAGIRMAGFRMLNTEDAFFKGLNYRMELHAQAYRKAAGEGLSGKKMAERMVDLIDNPTESIRMASMKTSAVNTFTNPNTFSKDITRWVNRPEHRWARFILPFINTPTNIVKYAIDRSPFAFASKAVQADIMKGGASRDLALSRIAIGTSAMVMAWKMATEGKITGGAPIDPSLRKIWMQENQEYSFKFGDKFYSYNRVEPMGMLFGFAADYSNIWHQLGDKEAQELGAAALLALQRNVTSKTWLKGLSDVVDAVAGSTEYKVISGFKQTTQNITSGFVPNFLNQVNREFVDPVLRDARGFQEGDFFARSLATLVDDAKKRIPGFSQDLPAQRNLWGEPIEPRVGFTDGTVDRAVNLLSPAYRKQVEGDPVNEMLLDNEIGIDMPRRKISVPGLSEGVELTATEYNRFVELSGKPAKERLNKLVERASFKQRDKEEKERAVKDVIRAFRVQAKGTLLKEYPEIMERAQERQARMAQ